MTKRSRLLEERLTVALDRAAEVRAAPAAAERLRAAGLDTFEALFAAPGPFLDRNRLRDVIRLPLGDVPYFRKRQHGIKGRDRYRAWLRFRHLRSHSREEARHLEQLARLGYRVPEPAALGESGDRSLLLLAELPGRPLDEYLAAVESDAEYDAIAAAVGTLCERLREDRVYWPDLDGRHVFVRADASDLDLGILDVQRLNVGIKWNDKRLTKMRERLTRSIAQVRGSAPVVRAATTVLS